MSVRHSGGRDCSKVEEEIAKLKGELALKKEGERTENN